MRKLKVLNGKSKAKKVDSKKKDALDAKKIKDTYKAALQLKEGAFIAIEKAYSMINALKKETRENYSFSDWNASFVQDLENLLKARNALKEIG